MMRTVVVVLLCVVACDAILSGLSPNWSPLDPTVSWPFTLDPEPDGSAALGALCWAIGKTHGCTGGSCSNQYDDPVLEDHGACRELSIDGSNFVVNSTMVSSFDPPDAIMGVSTWNSITTTPPLAFNLTCTETEETLDSHASACATGYVSGDGTTSVQLFRDYFGTVAGNNLDNLFWYIPDASLITLGASSFGSPFDAAATVTVTIDLPFDMTEMTPQPTIYYRVDGGAVMPLSSGSVTAASDFQAVIPIGDRYSVAGTGGLTVSLDISVDSETFTSGFQFVLPTPAPAGIAVTPTMVSRGGVGSPIEVSGTVNTVPSQLPLDWLVGPYCRVDPGGAELDVLVTQNGGTLECDLTSEMMSTPLAPATYAIQYCHRGFGEPSLQCTSAAQSLTIPANPTISTIVNNAASPKSGGFEVTVTGTGFVDLGASYSCRWTPIGAAAVVTAGTSLNAAGNTVNCPVPDLSSSTGNTAELQIGFDTLDQSYSQPMNFTFDLCGDGLVTGGELCDLPTVPEGTAPGFNCLSNLVTCTVPMAGWSCAANNCTAACGDGIIAGGYEKCDDGNEVGGDGCAADCLAVEKGYLCPTPGEPCTLAPDGPGQFSLEDIGLAAGVGVGLAFVVLVAGCVVTSKKKNENRRLARQKSDLDHKAKDLERMVVEEQKHEHELEEEVARDEKRIHQLEAELAAEKKREAELEAKLKKRDKSKGRVASKGRP